MPNYFMMVSVCILSIIKIEYMTKKWGKHRLEFYNIYLVTIRHMGSYIINGSLI